MILLIISFFLRGNVVVMSIEIRPCSEVRFLAFADKFGAPKPLRRTFSLMRLHGCKTIVCEERKWPDLCSLEECGLRFTSCQDYVNHLPHYNQHFIEKRCWKIGFFKTEFTKEEELQSQTDTDLMGFCVVQTDKFKDNKGVARARHYVTESLIKDPFEKEKRGVTFGPLSTTIRINAKDFKVVKNYFSQQNGITNCCAHAAIKMAIRGYYSDMTCERINTAVNIDHIHRRGSEGLTPDEMCTAIEVISGLRTYILHANEFSSPMDFLKAVYLAVESRFPVILLFTMPGETGDSHYGHAVALVGHTFNDHNWWPYGLKGYFASGDKNIAYLPSFLWCDNFIVQDDNFGPYYLMPARFLTDSPGLSGILSSIERAVLSTTPVSATESWLREPMSAIVIYPSQKPLVQDSFLVEPWAIATLNRYMSSPSNSELPTTEEFEKYFRAYQKQNYLILRTSIVGKDEYFSSPAGQVTPSYLAAVLKAKLPDTFWLTEISVPELFWINRAKVGEIITDPQLFAKNARDAVVFIRLPNMVTFFEGNNATYFHIDQDHPHHPLIYPKGLAPTVQQPYTFFRLFVHLPR